MHTRAFATLRAWSHCCMHRLDSGAKASLKVINSTYLCQVYLRYSRLVRFTWNS